MPEVMDKLIMHVRCEIIIAELSRAKRAQRSTMGKKMWLTTHPRKFGNYVTVHRPTDRPTDRPPDRPSARQAYQCKIIQSTGATQDFIWKEFPWPPGLLERKNNNEVVFFSTIFLMFALTWITEKKLERVIENKRDEFCRKKDMTAR